MTLAQFWTQVDAEQAASATAIRRDPRIEFLYRHAVAFESWRHNLFATRLGMGLPFWYEAQNDYLLSLVHGGRGIWRSSLQALRSFLENASGALYYAEHPIEARRFQKDDFRLTWTDTKQYFASYPYSTPAEFASRLWESLANEYSELSKAVHGSSERFRMTAAQQFPTLSSADPALAGAWRTRASHCARAIQLLLLQHFTSELVGARLPGLREDVARALGAKDRAKVKQSLGIVLRISP